MKNKNILITGGLGFIGSHIANKLIDIELIDISFEGNYNSGEKYKTLI